jgi:hypothetical protein
MTVRQSEIYCDEHGNTGEHLLDPEQPVFTLASDDFSAQEAGELIGRLQTQGALEVKFKTLRKTKAGWDRLIPWLFDPRLGAQRVAIFAMEKRFMVYTKMVDLVMETLMHSAGQDLYVEGANLATANYMASCVPVFCGKEPTQAMLEAFVQLIRRRQPAEVDAYVQAGQVLLAACSDDQTRDFLVPFFERELVPDWLDDMPTYLLDPAIPSLFQIIDTWGRRKVDRFEVVHDQSKPILASEAFFNQLMAEANEASRLVGYDRRQFLFPLRASRLRMGDSVAYPQLQIADVCAGLAAYWMRAKLTGKEDDLSKAFVAAGGLTWFVGGVIHSTDVTRNDLGTTGGGTNPIDPLAARAARQPN